MDARIPSTSKSTVLVIAIIALCALATGSVVAITIIRPEADNTVLITTLLGIQVPVVMALLAAVLQQVHADVNSRLTQFLELTAKAGLAEGKLEGKAEADALK